MPYNVPMIWRRCLVGGAEEAVSGTEQAVANVLAATYIYNAQFDSQDMFSTGRRQPDGNYLGNVAAVKGLKAGRATFITQPTKADQSLAMLSMCGMALTGSTWKPLTSWANRKTWSLDNWVGGVKTTLDAVKKVLYGCAADLTIVLRPGAPCIFEWSVDGIWKKPATELAAAVPDPPAVANLPLVCTGLQALTLVAGTPVELPSEVRIRLGNSIGMRPDMTASSGIGHFYVAERNVSVEMDPEAKLIATLDDYGIMEDGTEVEFCARLVRGTTTLEFKCPKAQRIGIVESERDGIRVRNMTFQCNADAGDDEIGITYATWA